MPAMTPRQWALLILLSALWGATFLFNGIILRELPPVTLVLGRVLITSAILAPIVVAMRWGFPSTLAAWSPFLVMALLNNAIPFALIAYGQSEIGGALASVLNATTPLFSVLLGAFWTREERFLPHRIVGVGLGIAGVGVLVGPEAVGGSEARALGMVAILGASICYALSAIWARRFKASPPLRTTCCQMIASSAILAPAAALIDKPWTLAMPGAGTWAALVGLAVLSTAAAYAIYFRLIQSAGPTNVMLVTLLIPVTATAFGVGLLGEVLQTRHILGALVIGLALVMIDGRVMRWGKRGSSA